MAHSIKAFRGIAISLAILCSTAIYSAFTADPPAPSFSPSSPQAAGLFRNGTQAGALNKLSCLGLLILVAACSTAGPNAVARGAACETPGQLAYDASGAPLVCGEAAAGVATMTWGIPGIDKPITATAKRNAHCSRVGALASAADGSVMVCTWNNPDLASNKEAGGSHGN